MARPGTGCRPSPRRSPPSRRRHRSAPVAALVAGCPVRRGGTRAVGGAERRTGTGGLHRPGGPGAGGEGAGGVRLDGRPADRGGTDAGPAAPVVAGRPAGGRHRGPRVVLAYRVPAGSGRTAGPIPTPPMAGGPTHRGGNRVGAAPTLTARRRAVSRQQATVALPAAPCRGRGAAPRPGAAVLRRCRARAGT